MSRLSHLDTAFLHLETARCPMSVGAVLSFAPLPGERMSFQRLRAHIAARLQRHAAFSQRLQAHAGGYRWQAVEVDIDRHLRMLQVAAPWQDERLQAVVADFFAHPLDRQRPLWEALYIEPDPDVAGLKGRGEDTAFMVLLKVHHAAVDGVSAEAILRALFDDRAAVDMARPVPTQAQPTALTRLGYAATALWRRFSVSPWRDLPIYMRAPQTPFADRQVSEHQQLAVTLAMPRLQAIKASLPGATLNDVILAGIAGGMRAYLSERGQLPQQSLVAMTPVSRRQQAHGIGGNQVSAMLIDLATDCAEAGSRLARIHAMSRVAKAYNQALPIEKLLPLVPAQALAYGLSAWRQLGLSQHLPPLFNMVITNVPGSRQPLSLAGFPLTRMQGVAPIYDGHAMTIVVLSYVDQVSLSIATTRTAVPDPARLRQHIEQAYGELEQAMLGEQTATTVAAEPVLARQA